MPYPILIEFVQVFHCALADSVTTAIERVLQNPIHQIDHFLQNCRGIPSIAAATDYSLKSGNEKTLLCDFEVPCASGTNEQVGEDAGQTQHPYFEITRAKLDRTPLLECSHRHACETKNRVLRL